MTDGSAIKAFTCQLCQISANVTVIMTESISTYCLFWLLQKFILLANVYILFNACSISLIKSFTSSIPTDNRTIEGVTSALANCSSVIPY